MELKFWVLMKFGCGHSHKTSSIEGTNWDIRPPIVKGTHLSYSNVEKSTGWIVLTQICHTLRWMKFNGCGHPHTNVHRFLYKWSPSMPYISGHWDGWNSVVVTPTKRWVLREPIKAWGHHCNGAHASCSIMEKSTRCLDVPSYLHKWPLSMSYVPMDEIQRLWSPPQNIQHWGNRSKHEVKNCNGDTSILYQCGKANMVVRCVIVLTAQLHCGWIETVEGTRFVLRLVQYPCP